MTDVRAGGSVARDACRRTRSGTAAPAGWGAAVRVAVRWRGWGVMGWPRWRALADAADPPRVLVGEVNLEPARAARYSARGSCTRRSPSACSPRRGTSAGVGPGWAPSCSPPGCRAAAPVTWVTENHDIARSPTRYAPEAWLGASPPRVAHPAPASSTCSANPRIPPRVAHPGRGAARARAALLAVLGLPGGAYLYQGQELGLPEVDVPEAARQDPMWARGGVSRDGCRVPMPWRRDPAGAFGFSDDPDAVPWLPVPDGWARCPSRRPNADPASVLHLSRAALAVPASAARRGGADGGRPGRVGAVGRRPSALRRRARGGSRWW